MTKLRNLTLMALKYSYCWLIDSNSSQFSEIFGMMSTFFCNKNIHDQKNTEVMVTGLSMADEFSFNQSNKLYTCKNLRHALGQS